MPSISVTWHTQHDDRVCPICQEIEDYTWIFEAGQDAMTGQLTHPTFGVVWDLASGSAAHGHRGNCRCFLTHEISLKDLIERMEKLRDRLKANPFPAEQESKYY